MPNYTILLIDYEPRSLKRLRAPLDEAGYQVVAIQDGKTGIEAFNDLKPAMAFVEAMLPKKNGFEVCLELNKTSHRADSAVVMISSVYTGRKYRNQAMHQHGCDEFLEKPISDQQLLETVRRFVKDVPGARNAVPAEIDRTEADISDHLDSILS